MRTLLLLGLAAVVPVTAHGDTEPASQRRTALRAEFGYAPPPPVASFEADRLPTPDEPAEALLMPAFHVAELRPRIVRDLQHQWNVQERLRVKAAVVKDFGRMQLVLLQPPGIVPLPLGAGLSIPVLSLRW